MEKARESVDISNARAAYAEVMSAALTGDTSPEDTTITYTSATKTWSKEVTLTQKKADWTTDMTEVKVGGVTATGSPTVGGKVTISYVDQAALPTVVFS